MEKYKYLLKNVGLLTISQFTSKLLSFFLVPLYTHILTTEEYGIFDVIGTTISVLVPFLTLNISESVLRFSINKNNSKKTAFSIGFKYLICGNLIFIFVICVIKCFFDFEIINRYWIYIFLMFFFASFNGILVNFSRGIDKVFALAVSGIVCSVITLCLNILFLLVLDYGINGYFLSGIIGSFSQFICLMFGTKFYRYIKLKSFDKSLKREMLQFSVPQIPNSIAWWVNSASDRYVVLWLCGLSNTGIYSVSYKIPSMLSIIQSIFSQAWTISAVKEFDPEDKDGFFSNNYNTYNSIMVLACSVLIVLTKPLSYILFSNEFYEAWNYVSVLLISVVFGSLSGYIGGIFSAVKDAKAYSYSTVAGAIVNIVVSIVLTYFFGVIGAAIGTLVSYFVVFIIRLKTVKKYIKIKIEFNKSLLAYIILCIQAFLYNSSINFNIIIAVNIICVITIILLFKTRFLNIILLFFKSIKRS